MYNRIKAGDARTFFVEGNAMIYFFDAGGNMAHCVPQRIYQGSAEGNKLLLVAPFAASASLLAAFTLPDGTSTERYTMQFMGGIAGVYDGEGAGMNGWQLDLPRCAAAQYGTVTVQFYRLSGEDTLATFAARFTVERGVAEVLPAAPSAEVYSSLLSALAQVKAGMQNGDCAARALRGWSEGQTYGAGDTVFYFDEDGGVKLLRSKTAENDAPPYTDGALDGTNWQEIPLAFGGGGGDSSLASAVAEVETAVSGLETEVSGFTSSLSEMETAVSGLETEVSGFTSSLSEVETAVSGLETEVSGFTSSLSEVETAVSGLETEVSGFTSSLSEVETAVSGLETAMTGVQSAVAEAESAVEGEAQLREAADQALMALIDDIEDGTTTVAKAAQAETAASAQTAVSAQTAQTAVSAQTAQTATSAQTAQTATTASSATKATQDALGNDISSTYLKKAEKPAPHYEHNVTVRAGDGGVITLRYIDTSADALADAEDLLAVLDAGGFSVSAGPSLLPAGGYVVVSAGSAEVLYPVVGVGKYGNRTDAVGFYYFRTDTSVGRAGYQMLALGSVTAFTDAVRAVG